MICDVTGVFQLIVVLLRPVVRGMLPLTKKVKYSIDVVSRG